MTELGVDCGAACEIGGRRVRLVPLRDHHVTDRYVAWTGDSDVNQYTRRLGKPPQTKAEIRAWMAGLGRDEIVLAIETEEFGHIGNIKYGPINWSNLDADVSILIGERAAWGRGFGAEAHYLVAKHLFWHRGLNRVHAASINPAYIRMVEKLGWVREGIQREEARVGGAFYDSVLLGHLRREFRIRAEYEAVA